MNFAENLELMRRKWAKGLKIMGYLPRPYWIFHHPLFQTYKDAKILRKHGQVYYAALVQANSQMFGPVRADNIPGNPGAVLYSMRPPYDTDPIALRHMASALFGYKNKKNAPEEWKDVVAQITNEHTVRFNQAIPALSDEGGEAIYTAIMFFRQHLPKDRLIGPIFPILAAPDHCDSIMVLPRRYWTKEIKAYYLSFQ